MSFFLPNYDQKWPKSEKSAISNFRRKIHLVLEFLFKLAAQIWHGASLGGKKSSQELFFNFDFLPPKNGPIVRKWQKITKNVKIGTFGPFFSTKNQNFKNRSLEDLFVALGMRQA